MSYWVNLEIRTGPDHLEKVVEHNISINYSTAMKEAGLDLPKLNGLWAASCISTVEHCITEFETRPDLYRQFMHRTDYDQRGRNLQKLIEDLKSLVKSLKKHTFATVRVAY